MTAIGVPSSLHTWRVKFGYANDQHVLRNIGVDVFSDTVCAAAEGSLDADVVTGTCDRDFTRTNEYDINSTELSHVFYEWAGKPAGYGECARAAGR